MGPWRWSRQPLRNEWTIRGPGRDFHDLSCTYLPFRQLAEEVTAESIGSVLLHMNKQGSHDFK